MTTATEPLPSARSAIAWPSVLALAVEVAVCAGVIALAMRSWAWWSVALAFVVVATRQHALFILYHDAVHGLLARSRRLNDLLINVLAGVPMLLPVHVYRRFHVSHHATLGTVHDTERILLYRHQPWQYRPLPLTMLARQLLGDLLLLNQLRTGLALLREERDPDTLLRLPPRRPYPETFALQALCFAGLATWAWVDLGSFGRFALLWFVPLLTLTQAIQKVRSFAEHAPLDAPELTYSWRPGLLGRLVLWPYNINYHREHHDRPAVRWYELPAAFPDAVQRPAADLVRLLWNGRLVRHADRGENG